MKYANKIRALLLLILKKGMRMCISAIQAILDNRFGVNDVCLYQNKIVKTEDIKKNNSE